MLAFYFLTKSFALYYFILVYLSIYTNYTIGGEKPYLTVFDVYSALRKGLEIQLSLLNATFYKQPSRPDSTVVFVKSSIF